MRGTVISVVKNNLGICGTIKAGNKKYYYNTNGVTKGLYMKKGLIVDFDVVVQADGREKAINIKENNKNLSVKMKDLTELQKNDLVVAINESMGGNDFVASASIPHILNKLGICDFREYAESIEAFIVAYFFEEFVFVKNFDYDGKIYPGIVAKKNWISTVQLPDKNLVDKKELTGEDIENISNQMLEVCDRDGFLLGSALPGILKTNGISSYKNFAESIDLFIARYFGEIFIVLKSIEKNGKKYPTAIIQKEKLDEFAENVYPKIDNIDEAIESIDRRIEEAIVSNGFLLQSEIPFILSDYGIDYKEHATNLNDFIQRFFYGKYMTKTNHWVNGKLLPNVLLLTDSEKIQNEEFEADNTENIDYALLDELFNTKKYYEYLRGIQLPGLSLDNVHEEYIEKAISCAMDLLNIDSSEFSLNLFQKEMFFCRTGKDFIHKWKKATGYQNTILANYEKSSIVDVNITEDIGLITKLINNAGADTKINNSFVSVASRFEACMDSLVFPIYMIRLCAPVSQKKIEKTMGDFCAFIKNLRASTIAQRVDVSYLLTMLERILKIVVEIIEEPLSKNACTNIVSVYFDLNYQDRIPDLLSIICKDSEDPLLIISDFLTNYEVWDSKQYSILFENGISLRIIEKICAYIWHQCRNQNNMPRVVLNILAHILANSNQSVIDEIVRLHITQEYTKKQKIDMLINSFHYLIEKINDDYLWFALALYVESNFAEYITDNEDNLDIQSVSDIRNWKNIADLFLMEKIKEIGELNDSNEGEYLKLFQLFEGDTEKIHLLQKKYNDWFGQSHDWYSNASCSEIEDYLSDVYSKKVDYTFAFIYEFAKENDIPISNDYALKYVDSLIRMKKFDKVIRFANNTDILTNDEKRDVIVQAVYDNFYEYGISEEAYLIFSEEFSVSDAIASLEKNILPTRFSQVIALIILYAKNGELLKSAYLYALYHDHAETGYTRLYSQYRSSYGRHISRLHDHYDVIIKAFNSLPYDSLLDFLEWSSSIMVPNFSEYSPRRDSFSYFIDEILKDSQDVSVWKRFIAHLYSHRDIESNKWLLCVSAIIARNKFQAPNLGEIRKIFIDILNSEDLSRWPDNLIYYVTTYVVENDDDVLCEQLYEALSNNNFVDRSIFDNPWCTMTKKMDFFTDYCVNRLRETSEPLYFNLLTLLKRDLSGSELVELSSYSVNKVFLLNIMAQLSRQKSKTFIMN